MEPKPEEISLLMDGELDAERVERVCGSLRQAPCVATWVCYHVIGDALRIEFAVHQQRDFLRRSARLRREFAHHHLRSFSVPSSGRSSAAIASRARKIRERTVPIGQFITLAISS